MGKPSWMSAGYWSRCVSYANKYNTWPELLAAIGWHETHWGRLGWGRKGFILGVGCYSRTRANYAFQGIEAQLTWAAKRLGQYLDRNVTRQGLRSFAREVWKPGNPTAWADSVWKIYLDLGGKAGSEKTAPFVGKTTLKISPGLELRSIITSTWRIVDYLRDYRFKHKAG